MANTILTATNVTRKALKILHQKLNFVGNVNRQYDKTYESGGGAVVKGKFGPDLKIRLPNEYTVRSGMTMGTPNDTVEASETLTVSTVKGVDLEMSSLDLSLSIDELAERVLDPAMSVLAANIEADAISMYKSVYNLIDGDAAAFAFTHPSLAREKLTLNLAPPSPRFCNLNPFHTTKYIDAVKGLFHDGDAVEQQYREGKIGRAQGFTFFENTLLTDHTTGTAAKTTGYLSNGATQSGASIIVDTGTTTFLKGDVITFAGVFRVHPETKVSTGILQQFVITADSGASATSLAISPAVVATGGRQNVSNTVADNSAVVKVGAGASELLNTSLAYHRDAFVFVTAPLEMPKGVNFAAREVMDGISLSLVGDFVITTRQFPYRVDCLYGYKAVRPQLACRIHADG